MAPKLLLPWVSSRGPYSLHMVQGIYREGIQGCRNQGLQQGCIVWIVESSSRFCMRWFAFGLHSSFGVVVCFCVCSKRLVVDGVYSVCHVNLPVVTMRADGVTLLGSLCLLFFVMSFGWDNTVEVRRQVHSGRLLCKLWRSLQVQSCWRAQRV